MANRSKIVPSFPDIKVPEGGRFGGMLLGVQGAIEQGNVNRKYSEASKLLGARQSAMDVRSERRNAISLYNAAAKRLDARNKEKRDSPIYDTAGNLVPEEPEKMPPFNEFVQSMSGATTPGTAVPEPSYFEKNIQGGGAFSETPPRGGAGLLGTPQGGQNIFQKIGAGVQNVGQRIGAGAQNIKQQLQQLLGGAQQGGVMGSPQGVMAQPATGGQGPSTEDLITALDDYDDAETAIAQLVELDASFDRVGFDLGENIDIDAFLEAFRQKFGDSAVQRLIAAVD